MATKIRLTRLGKHKQPTYRIVVVSSRTRRDGEYIELLGTYNPLKQKTEVDSALAIKWLNNGAIPSETVKEIFTQKNIIKQFNEQKSKK